MISLNEMVSLGEFVKTAVGVLSCGLLVFVLVWVVWSRIDSFAKPKILALRDKRDRRSATIPALAIVKMLENPKLEWEFSNNLGGYFGECTISPTETFCVNYYPGLSQSISLTRNHQCIFDRHLTPSSKRVIFTAMCARKELNWTKTLLQQDQEALDVLVSVFHA